MAGVIILWHCWGIVSRQGAGGGTTGVHTNLPGQATRQPPASMYGLEAAHRQPGAAIGVAQCGCRHPGVAQHSKNRQIS